MIVSPPHEAAISESACFANDASTPTRSTRAAEAVSIAMVVNTAPRFARQIDARPIRCVQRIAVRQEA